MNKTRHLLISILLCPWVLTAIGCQRSGGSIEPNETSNSAYSELAISDLAPSNDIHEDAEPLKVGDKAPDFEVEVMEGSLLRLSSFLAEVNGPIVLLFDRAHW